MTTGAERRAPHTEKVEVVRRGREHDGEMFRLYEEVFGADATAASRRRWTWQYERNPAVAATGPVIWMAREGERLLGQMAALRVRLWFGGREVQASWGNDYFVRVDAQGRGLGALLSNAWSDHEDVALALGLTPSSYPLFKKLGFVDVGPVPFYQKVMDARAVARRRLGARAGTMAAPGLAAFLRLRFGRPPRPPDDVEVRAVADFSPECDDLWERARASYTMCVRRDLGYLRWKYLECPHRRYDLLEARRRDELVGYAASRLDDHRGTRLGWIVDVFTDTRDEGAKEALVHSLLSSFRTAGVARAQAYSLNGPLAATLRRFGFFPGFSAVQFCVKSAVDPQGALADVGGWNLMFGDGDLDR
ncbi:MAG TPA: GNAT family N-acetyltransferase [Vicinamibacteria bacterium]|nr:GNAT family N-acetyltransferase [Vicinamibacteria bacterium]